MEKESGVKPKLNAKDFLKIYWNVYSLGEISDEDLWKEAQLLEKFIQMRKEEENLTKKEAFDEFLDYHCYRVHQKFVKELHMEAYGRIRGRVIQLTKLKTEEEKKEFILKMIDFLTPLEWDVLYKMNIGGFTAIELLEAIHKVGFDKFEKVELPLRSLGLSLSIIDELK